MTRHLPILLVLVPLLTAPFCVLLKHPVIARVLALLASSCSTLIAFAMVKLTLDGTQLHYQLGGWQPPWGIEYKVDATSAFVALLVCIIATISLFFGFTKKQVRLERHYLFAAAFLLCLTGLLGICVTGDAFNVFVFLEISSLSTYTLVAMGGRRNALSAAFNYLIMGTIGGTFILIAIGLLYQMTGTLNMADLANRLQAVQGSRTMLVAFAFMMVGIAIKLAVFPLHQWLPDAYAEAPSSVSAFVAGTSTKVIYYFLARVLFTLFGAAFVFESLGFRSVLMPISILAMFGGSLAAIYQTNIKRLFAYSSIAQIGYLTLALSFGTQEGIAAGLMHMWGHGLTKSGVFLVIGCIFAVKGTHKISELRGIAHTMPVSTALLALGGLSLIGVPGTVGFISKWYLVSAAFKAGYPLVAVTILVSSLLAVVYVWKLVEVAFFKSEGDKEAERQEAPFALLVPAALLVLSVVFFGLYTKLPVAASWMAASQLMGGTP